MQRICLCVLLVSIAAVGCADRGSPDPRGVIDGGGKKDAIDPIGVGLKDLRDKDGGKGDPLPPVGDGVTATLPEMTKDERYEAALFRAIEYLAKKEYADSLKALEEAQALKDTGTVQREIDKVRLILAQNEAADKAARDVRAVLDDGKPAEAAKLANEALGQYGGGDAADVLSRLQQQAEAEVTAGDDNKAARCATLKADADAAERDGNLRAAAVALEQAQALAPDDRAEAKLTDLRARLAAYDENRKQASEWRRDPVTLEQALTRLKAAQARWDTLQIRQEIDELSLLMGRRRDRLTVADFEVRGDVGLPAAGVSVAETLLPHFRPRYDIVERGMLSKVAEELKLEQSDLFEAGAGRRELGRLAKVRYLVVGSITPLGGVTANARLVEMSTGVIVQTARVSAPTMEKLTPRLKDLAVMLQMDDAAKAAYEERLIAAYAAVPPISDKPLETIPPPPPAPVIVVGAPPPPVVVVTYSPRPPVLGTVVVTDLAPSRLPPLLIVDAAPPPPPPALAIVLRRDDPRRNRMFALSLSLGDDLYRRGQYAEAQRHFSLALTLGGPRRELTVRLDNCRTYAPPPPPVAFVPTPAFAPVASPVPVAVALRPRMVVFGFVPGRADLVPPRATDLLADQLASYFAGQYEMVDRGELSWYMGRLNLTVADVLNDPVSRRCLAESIGARYFTFTALTAGSLKMDSHVIDAQTNTRTGSASIVAANHDELKMRLGEVAKQLGAKPSEREAVAKQAAATDKAVTEARTLLAKDPRAAAARATAALKAAPENSALLAIKQEAEKRERLKKFDEDRRAETAKLALVQEAAKKRQQELAIQSALVKAKAEADAKTRTEAQKREVQARREKAADQLQAQAKMASAKGDNASAARLLQSSTRMKPNEAGFAELAKARLQAEADAKARAKDAEDKRLAAQSAARESAAARVEKERQARQSADAERKKSAQARDKALHDKYIKDGTADLKAGKPADALADAQAAQKLLASPEAARLMRDAQDALAAAQAKTDVEKKRLAEEAKKRADAELAERKSREAYTTALTGAAADVKAGSLDAAIAKYTAAAKLFPGDPVATNGLRAAQEAKKRKEDAERAARDADSRKKARLSELASLAKTAEGKRDWAGAVKSYREALTLAPGDVALGAALAKAERAQTEDLARARREQEEKTRKGEVAKLVGAGSAHLAAKRGKEAADAFRRALGLGPTSAEAKVGLASAEKLIPAPVDPLAKKRQEDYQLAMDAGTAAVKANNLQGAMFSYREALRLMPGDAKATAAYASAEKLLREATERDTKGKAEAAYKKAYGEGSALLKERRFADAAKSFDAALVAKPGDTAAIEGKRQALEGMKPPPADPRKAAYEKAMSTARALVKAGKHGDAVREFDEALKQVPGDKAALSERTAAVDTLYQAWYRQGQTLLGGRKFAEAKAAFDNALAVKPGDRPALEGKRQAEDGMKPPPVDAKKVAFDKAMAAGRAATAKGDHAGALAAYSEALKLIPGDPTATKLRTEAQAAQREAAYQAAYRQGQALLAGRKFAEARAAFDQALANKPGDRLASEGKRQAEDGMKPPPVDAKKVAFDKAMAAGRSATVKGDHAAALAAYNEALKHFPADATALKLRNEADAQYRAGLYTAWLTQGQAHLAGRKFAEARAAFDNALKVRPGDAAAIDGKRKAEAGLKPPAPAVNVAEHRKQLAAAQASEKAGRWAEAARAYRAAAEAVIGDAKLAKEQHAAYAGLGRAEHAQKRYDEAVAAYTEALARVPGDKAIADALARARMRK